jgi:hypothetical protein
MYLKITLSYSCALQLSDNPLLSTEMSILLAVINKMIFSSDNKNDTNVFRNNLQC